MEIILNGKDYRLDSEISIASLVSKLGIESKAMAIALNTQVIKREAWAEQVLKAGDEVEILDFVGGG